MKQVAFSVSSHLSELAAYVAKLEGELEQARREVADLRRQLTSAHGLTWGERLLDAYAVGKGKDLYRHLFEALPEEARSRGRMSPFILALFSNHLPQARSFNDLRKMKAAGDLTERQVEIYDAINTFKSQCSYRKWLG